MCVNRWQILYSHSAKLSILFQGVCVILQSFQWIYSGHVYVGSSHGSSVQFIPTVSKYTGKYIIVFQVRKLHNSEAMRYCEIWEITVFSMYLQRNLSNYKNMYDEFI